MAENSGDLLPGSARPGALNEFIEGLDLKPAAKIDGSVDEHLNGREPSVPPPEYPVSSQI